MSENDGNNNFINPKCSKCRCYFIQDEFKSSGLPYSTCKKCRARDKSRNKNNKEYQKEWREQNKDKIIQYREQNKDIIKDKNKEYREKNKETIKEYKKEYDKDYRFNNKNKLKKMKEKYYENNKDKIKEWREQNKDTINEWKEKNKDKMIEYHKKYYNQNKGKIDERKEQNKDKIKIYQKEYYEQNKDKIFDKMKCEHNKFKQACKLCNFKLYLVNLQRTQIKRCLKKSNLNKYKHSIEYLGCSIQDLIDIFEQKMKSYNELFENNENIMTWYNTHMDHIKPISRFNLDDENEFLDCCHYSNLQPLLVNDNLEKHNKWTDENEKFWQEHIKNKEYKKVYLI
jgi:hypothetical protein